MPRIGLSMLLNRVKSWREVKGGAMTLIGLSAGFKGIRCKRVGLGRETLLLNRRKMFLLSETGLQRKLICLN